MREITVMPIMCGTHPQVHPSAHTEQPLVHDRWALLPLLLAPHPLKPFSPFNAPSPLHLAWVARACR